jgi:hypothetical protein
MSYQTDSISQTEFLRPVAVVDEVTHNSARALPML